MSPARGPWYITQHAVERFLYLMRWRDTDENFARAERRLIDLIPTATLREQRGTMQLWRSGLPGHKLRWLVSLAESEDGDLPQLVWVGQGKPPDKWWPAEGGE